MSTRKQTRSPRCLQESDRQPTRATHLHAAALAVESSLRRYREACRLNQAHHMTVVCITDGVGAKESPRGPTPAALSQRQLHCTHPIAFTFGMLKLNQS